MKVLTYNTLFGGFDGAAATRYDLLVSVIRRAKPDVLLLQELKGYLEDGARRALRFERDIGMRGFIGPAPVTGQNTGIFISPEIQPLKFEVDASHFHHVASFLEARVPGWEDPVTFTSVHLCPNGPVVRRREAAYLMVHAAPERLTVIGGDFNSASPHDPEPVDWPDLVPHHSSRYAADDLTGIDRSVLSALGAAGWVDLAKQLDAAGTATVPTPAYRQSEFATMRCDYLLASQALAAHARGYEVIRDGSTATASDHYPVIATFEPAV